ncbi:hypothetical protein PPACK8108_LOCUS14121 [Phakopsora pachyrhizi]|uniref:Uncharacterized protein n=1 Tax=Phakopsora pachyrhizi TaxID=170000 RepID=A0AAV0B9C6_PHAPC|nr:hypothetical protein PPACK8108_LOCUS14121 [Phakopsora pachyrhizi]
MSMKPIVIPILMILFRYLKFQGLMLTDWLMRASREERVMMIEDLIDLIDRSKIEDLEESFDVLDLSQSFGTKIDDQFSLERQKYLETALGGNKSYKNILLKFS